MERNSSYSEQTDMDEAAIQKWISVKEDLGVFAPRKPSSGPNYASKDVIRQLREEFPSFNLGDSRPRVGVVAAQGHYRVKTRKPVSTPPANIRFHITFARPVASK